VTRRSILCSHDNILRDRGPEFTFSCVSAGCWTPSAEFQQINHIELALSVFMIAKQEDAISRQGPIMDREGCFDSGQAYSQKFF
jgi:hypothetical protein